MEIKRLAAVAALLSYHIVQKKQRNEVEYRHIAESEKTQKKCRI